MQQRRDERGYTLFVAGGGEINAYQGGLVDLVGVGGDVIRRLDEEVNRLGRGEVAVHLFDVHVAVGERRLALCPEHGAQRADALLTLLGVAAQRTSTLKTSLKAGDDISGPRVGQA